MSLVIDRAELERALPIGSVNKLSTGWWGVWTLIVTESALFGYLLFSYYYLILQTPEHWPPEGKPRLFWSSLNTVILLSSSVFVWAGERFLRRRRRPLSLVALAVAIVLGAIFIGIQLMEWRDKGYGIASNLYGSLYYTITGFHLIHVAVGLVILSLLLLWTALGYFDEKRYATLTIGSLYWHFVDVVWLFIFSTFFLVPYLQ